MGLWGRVPRALCHPASPRSHHSGEVPVGAFCRVTGAAPPCPCALSALEEHNFLFQLQAPERPPEDAKEVGGPGGGGVWGGAPPSVTT